MEYPSKNYTLNGVLTICCGKLGAQAIRQIGVL
jgi:hypothetical protein